MVNYTNIHIQWHAITHRTIECEESLDRFLSLKGRGISLAYTLFTPLTLISNIGKLILTTIEVATITFAVITLNAPYHDLNQAGANIVDVTLGAALLPFAITAHLTRGIAGTIFHPKYMIKKIDFILAGTQNGFFNGTIVNY